MKQRKSAACKLCYRHWQ